MFDNLKKAVGIKPSLSKLEKEQLEANKNKLQDFSKNNPSKVNSILRNMQVFLNYHDNKIGAKPVARDQIYRKILSTGDNDTRKILDVIKIVIALTAKTAIGTNKEVDGWREAVRIMSTSAVPSPKLGVKESMFTRKYLKQVITEEIEKMVEADMETKITLDPVKEQPYYDSIMSVIRRGDKNEIAKAKEELKKNTLIGQKILNKINQDFPDQKNIQ